VSSANPDLKQRLEREAKAICSLNHPCICTCRDVGSQDGVDFLMMEHQEGETLLGIESQIDRHC
jgi:serine/threonine protein kinase